MKIPNDHLCSEIFHFLAVDIVEIETNIRIEPTIKEEKQIMSPSLNQFPLPVGSSEKSPKTIENNPAKSSAIGPNLLDSLKI